MPYITDKDAQLGFKKACKNEACGANNCGGAVPDIILPRVVDPNSRAHGISHTDQVYDVKTCGYRIFNGSKKSSCGYGRWCREKTPVQFMEDEVPGLWQTKIRNVDTKWNQTKGGDLGPAAQFYATIPKGVIGLGAGAYGETGRGIQEYHELIANHASTIMDSAVSSTTPYYNRFSCCHGADDAYARIYGYFKRQLARVSVRAAMLVRLRALDVVLGRSPRPESSTDRKEAKRAKATRLAAVHVVSESGIPADRGSFGA